MKLCILGGGGFRTPYVYQAWLREDAPQVHEVVLYDVDPHRLDVMRKILANMAAHAPGPSGTGRAPGVPGTSRAPRVSVSTDLREALRASDFVFAALRVGGLEGRRSDEHVALDVQVLGQETTGPGGLAYALRTVPVMVEIARIIHEVAPNAYVMNFTNPAGIITEAMQSVLGERVLGICDTPSGLGVRAAQALQLDATRIELDYVGLNHLGWLRRILYNGVDVLPRLLADSALLGTLEEAEIFGLPFLRELGALPNEYLYYYYFTRDSIRSIRDAGTTRGDFIAQTQRDFYTRAGESSAEGAAKAWDDAVAHRSASYMAEARGGTQEEPGVRAGELEVSEQGYAGVALGVMAAISANERRTMILNVRNAGTIAALPKDAVVEVPTLVDANGVHPLTLEAPNLHQLGLMAQVKYVEQLIIDAALTGSYEKALAAFSLHPLVDSANIAKQLLDGYIGAIPEVAAVFGNA